LRASNFDRTMDLDDLEKGLKILFNDRKTPLVVEEKEEGKAVVSGPNGGSYEIYLDGETLLVCRKGQRKYSSYCKDLRSVGEWVREEDEWSHSMTDGKVVLEKNESGFWTINVEGIEDTVDTPMYGYSKKEFAEEDAISFVKKHPEGK